MRPQGAARMDRTDDPPIDRRQVANARYAPALGERFSFLHMIESAIQLADLGYPVFPCMPDAKRPLTDNGFKAATTDAERIETWWHEHPTANVAIATKGLFVLDIDGQNNPWLTPDRAHDLAGGALSITPRGGRHYIFKQPAGRELRNTASKIAPHVDTRADGGYILVAPSMVDGKPYRWAESSGLEDAPERLSEPPAWLLDMLDGSAGDGAATRIEQSSESNAIPEGRRNATLASLAGSMRRVGMSQDEIKAALIRANLDRCKPPLSLPEVEGIVRSIARKEPDQIATLVAEGAALDFFGEAERATGPVDPGPIPERLLYVPGFINDVMQYTLETAPYPQPVLAFGGALALQAFLASRKVRDEADNRTNLYLATLASSGAGKDHPRKVIQTILTEVGLGQCVGDSMASAEGLEDALYVTPALIILADEVDGLLRSIKSGRDARADGLMSILLRLYTSANRQFVMRLKAGRERAGIDQPALTLYATGIPSRFYGAFTPQMIENGFLPRLMILEADKRGSGQESVKQAIPEPIMHVARYWADFNPSGKNLGDVHPVPREVKATQPAIDGLRAFRSESEHEWDSADTELAKAIWARVAENARRLALNYACSENHEAPEITANAVDWAVAFARHQARRMLFMTGTHVAETDFEAKCNRVLDVIRRWEREKGQASIPAYQLRRQLASFSPRELDETLNALLGQGRIVIEQAERAGAGRPGIRYRLA